MDERTRTPGEILRDSLRASLLGRVRAQADTDGDTYRDGYAAAERDMVAWLRREAEDAALVRATILLDTATPAPRRRPPCYRHGAGPPRSRRRCAARSAARRRASGLLEALTKPAPGQYRLTKQRDVVKLLFQNLNRTWKVRSMISGRQSVIREEDIL